MGTVYIGMDIHKSFIQAAVVNEQGKLLDEQRLDSDAAGIRRFVESIKADSIKVAIESSCTWYHVYDVLDSLGADTTLVNARRTRVIAESRIKTDKLDARNIAQCLSTGFIATAWIPPINVRELRSMARHRMSLNRGITRAKNMIRAILLRNGIKHEYSDLFGRRGMKFLNGLELGNSDRYRMNSYLSIVNALRKKKNW